MFQKCSGCFCSRSTGTHAEISHYLQRPLSCVTECFVALSLHVCLFCPLMRRLWGRSASRRPGVSPPQCEGKSPCQSWKTLEVMIAAFIFYIYTKHRRSYGTASVYLRPGCTAVCYCFNNRRCL